MNCIGIVSSSQSPLAQFGFETDEEAIGTSTVTGVVVNAAAYVSVRRKTTTQSFPDTWTSLIVRVNSFRVVPPLSTYAAFLLTGWETQKCSWLAGRDAGSRLHPFTAGRSSCRPASAAGGVGSRSVA